MDTGFASSFKEAVGRWRRRHRHPPSGETWFAVHYRPGWLVERLSFLESVHLLRQGLDVRALASERPPRRTKTKDGVPPPAAPKPADQPAGDLAGSSESLPGPN